MSRCSAKYLRPVLAGLRHSENARPEADLAVLIVRMPLLVIGVYYQMAKLHAAPPTPPAQPFFAVSLLSLHGYASIGRRRLWIHQS